MTEHVRFPVPSYLFLSLLRFTFVWNSTKPTFFCKAIYGKTTFYYKISDNLSIMEFDNNLFYILYSVQFLTYTIHRNDRIGKFISTGWSKESGNSLSDNYAAISLLPNKNLARIHSENWNWKSFRSRKSIYYSTLGKTHALVSFCYITRQLLSLTTLLMLTTDFATILEKTVGKASSILSVN